MDVEEIRRLVETHPLATSAEIVDRLVLLLARLSADAESRGMELRWGGETAAFELRAGEDSFAIALEEEMETQAVPDESVVPKYDWQRVPQVERKVFNGRLRLTVIFGRWQNPWWADRKRRSLDENLAEALNTVAEAAQKARTKREELRVTNELILKRWEEAVPKAREAYAHHLNAKRADAQVAAWKRARDLREYAAVAGGSEEWGAWLLTEADRIDPSLDKPNLTVVVPDEYPAAEVDKFMPHRWTVMGPPPPRTS